MHYEIITSTLLVRSGWLDSEIPLASILQSREAVHAKGVGNLAAVMNIMLHNVPDNPAAGNCVQLALPLILDSRLQICKSICPNISCMTCQVFSNPLTSSLAERGGLPGSAHLAKAAKPSSPSSRL